MNGSVLVYEENVLGVTRAEDRREPDTLASRAPPSSHAMLALQRTAGNQAVARRVAGTPATSIVDPRERVDRLERAIRQVFGTFVVIDREAASAALAGLTEQDGRAVRREYRSRRSRDLVDLISGESDVQNNLARADRKLLLILLGGTVAPAAAAPVDVRAAAGLTGSLVGGVASLLGSGDPDRLAGAVAEAFAAQVAGQQAHAEATATTKRYAAEAAALESALERGAVETVLSFIRRPKPERDALAEQYEHHFRTSLHTALVTRLNGRNFDRAMALWRDDLVTADRLALEGDIERQDKAEAEAERLEGAARLLPDLSDKLRRRRLEARAAVESRLEAIGGAGESTAEGRERSRAHLQEVVSEPGAGGTLRVALGVGWNSVATALVQDGEPEVLGARLARADAEGSLKQTDLEGVLRQLKALARQAVVREVERDPTLAAQADALLDATTATYYQRFRNRFDGNNPMRSLTTTLASVGGVVERERNLALLRARGEIPDWQELDFALRRKPKDMDTVRRVLAAKSKEQVDALAVEYGEKTEGHRSLEADLMGSPEEQLVAQFSDWGKAHEEQAEKRDLLRGGVFFSTAPDEPTRIAEEGRWTFGKIAALERRVMENRGLFAEARDWVGNIEHELVERARSDATDAKTALDLALTADPADVAAALAQLAELRNIETRLKNNVAVYKEATAAAFDEFVDFAVLAITTAITLGEGTAVVLAVRATAATIGTKLVLKGGDYLGSDEFWGDLRNGVANAAGGKAAESLLGPLALRLAETAQRTGLTTTLAVQRVAVWEASNFVSTGVANIVAGRAEAEGMGLEGQATNVGLHLIGSALRASRASAPARPETPGPMAIEGQPVLVGATGQPLSGPPAPSRPLLDLYGQPISAIGSGGRGLGGGLRASGSEPVRLYTAQGEPVLVSGGRAVGYPGRETPSAETRLVDPSGRRVAGPSESPRALVDEHGRPIEMPRAKGPTEVVGDPASGTPAAVAAPRTSTGPEAEASFESGRTQWTAGKRPQHFPSWETINARMTAQLPEGGRRAVVHAELLLERAEEPIVFTERSGERARDVPRTELTQPERRIWRPEHEHRLGTEGELKVHYPGRGDDPDTPNRGFGDLPPGEVEALSALEQAEPFDPEGRPPHHGPRAHDAEANLLERVSTTIGPDDRGELHFRTNFPTCPSCKELIFRFRERHPQIDVIVHTRETPPEIGSGGGGLRRAQGDTSAAVTTPHESIVDRIPTPESTAGSPAATAHMLAGASPSERIVLYRGTVYRWLHGGSGETHDLGPGLYMTSEAALGVKYAQERRAAEQVVNEGTPGIVMRVDIDAHELGRVLDVYHDVARRAEWESFLREQPNGDLVLVGQAGAEIYNPYFENWLARRGTPIDQFDTIIAPEYRNGGPQVCIRDKAVQTRVFAAWEEWARAHEPLGRAWPDAGVNP